ncbi:hypothetical protein Pta02_79140 [Planobispora takensis]|uniref:Uncharacterized protein n=1 Tax=Planobispora takensis TaxID=1367882 RepID=A0A8J3WXG4_9ACTN|nr:hypothetical protein Pta02_79140 [Planobispora takensis]
MGGPFVMLMRAETNCVAEWEGVIPAVALRGAQGREVIDLPRPRGGGERTRCPGRATQRGCSPIDCQYCKTKMRTAGTGPTWEDSNKERMPGKHR